MRASQMLIPTQKTAPQEAVISSHILLLRAGMIKKLVAGVYNYLPMGLRVLHKIENIIREEMDASGALEILSSAIQPKELWEESGRWFKYGPELMRLKDRHDREFCLGPTHEEIFTDLARDLFKSYKQLPINIYQIQTKYRDEMRPRFGLMRGREFIMKDAYSFDVDEAGIEKSYQIMYDTYDRIFKRFGLNFKAVLADTGAIGGNGSHQFMALSEVGESTICYCDTCGFAADVEKCEVVGEYTPNNSTLVKEVVDTPKMHTIEQVCNFLNVSPKQVCKSLIYSDDYNHKLVMVVLRGDRGLNEIKLVNALNIPEAFLRMATDEEIKSLGSAVGYSGPVGMNCEIYVDKEVVELDDTVVGANEYNKHLVHVAYGKDYTGKVLDLRLAENGDVCPVCGKPLKLERGIEVGQIFKLQTKYSEAMDAGVLNDKGEKIPFVMGCYGIGVTRTMASIIEQYHDDFGICWPLNVAPYHAVVVPISYEDEVQKELAEKIYKELKAKKVDVVLDDRLQKPGFKLKDWELIGVPYIIVVGRRAGEDIVEFKVRKENTKEEVTSTDAISKVVEAVNNL